MLHIIGEEKLLDDVPHEFEGIECREGGIICKNVKIT